jgi:hypothetical protein
VAILFLFGENSPNRFQLKKFTSALSSKPTRRPQFFRINIKNMDRFKLWIESQSSSHEDDPATVPASFSYVVRPPTLRTTSTYDDDEAFSKISLKLLATVELNGLSAKETIMQTLIQPRDRSSFLEGMHIRLSRSSQFSPSTASLVQSMFDQFGDELKRIVEEESGERNCHPFYSPHVSEEKRPPPTTPRHVRSHSSFQGAESNAQKTAAHPSSRRRFFSDSESGGFFCSRKVRNLDWKLAEAIQQVQSLRLDGTTPLAYQAPPMAWLEL